MTTNGLTVVVVVVVTVVLFVVILVVVLFVVVVTVVVVMITGAGFSSKEGGKYVTRSSVEGFGGLVGRVGPFSTTVKGVLDGLTVFNGFIVERYC